MAEGSRDHSPDRAFNRLSNGTLGLKVLYAHLHVTLDTRFSTMSVCLSALRRSCACLSVWMYVRRVVCHATLVCPYVSRYVWLFVLVYLSLSLTFHAIAGDHVWLRLDCRIQQSIRITGPPGRLIDRSLEQSRD